MVSLGVLSLNETLAISARVPSGHVPFGTSQAGWTNLLIASSLNRSGAKRRLFGSPCVAAIRSCSEVRHTKRTYNKIIKTSLSGWVAAKPYVRGPTVLVLANSGIYIERNRKASISELPVVPARQALVPTFRRLRGIFTMLHASPKIRQTLTLEGPVGCGALEGLNPSEPHRPCRGSNQCHWATTMM